METGVVFVEATIDTENPPFIALTPIGDPQGGIPFVAGDLQATGFYVKDNIGPGDMFFGWAVFD
jgi:hypothetical protein